MQEVNWKQFEKNKKTISKKVANKFPGAKVLWADDVVAGKTTPTIEAPDSYTGREEELKSFVQDLISSMGGDAAFR